MESCLFFALSSDDLLVHAATMQQDFKSTCARRDAQNTVSTRVRARMEKHARTRPDLNSVVMLRT